jgi:glycosyltransferase involved in cell wall biosynthesis
VRDLFGRQGGEPFIEADVLFLLPGIRQGVGGIHVVMDLCNHLIRKGVTAKAAVFGLDPEALAEYQEPILFGLLHFPDEVSLACEKLLKPKCVASTLFSTALPAFGLAKLHGVPIVSLIQGYEVYFDNGLHRRDVESSYLLADEFITTSRWLEGSIRRPGRLRPTTVLPIGVNEWLFSSGNQRERNSGKVRVGIILRSAPDKGQWVLLELMHRLLDWRDRFCVTLMAADLRSTPREWLEEPDSVIRSLPLDRGNMASCFQDCDVVLDASFHEGFGLVPLEAMACGAAIVCSDSGGVGQFVRHEVNGLLVPEVNKPERFLAALTRLVDDRELLRRLQQGAVQTAREFTEAGCFDGYVRFFRDRAARAAQTREETGPRISEAQSLALATAEKYSVELGPLVLRAIGSDPYLLLPKFQLNGARGIVLKVDIDSPVDTMLQLFYCRDPLSLMSDGSALRRMLRAKDRLLVKLRNGTSSGRHEFSEERSVRCPIHRGKNLLHIELPYADLEGRLRFDPGISAGDYVLKELEVRGVEGGPSAEMAFEASKRSYLKLSKELGYGGLEPLHDVKLLRTLELLRVEWTVASAHIVTIDIESPDASVLQLYWQTKGSPWFSEDRSTRRLLRKGRNLISCLLLEPNLSGALRLNPGNADGEYSLRALEVQAIE